MTVFIKREAVSAYIGEEAGATWRVQVLSHVLSQLDPPTVHRVLADVGRQQSWLVQSYAVVSLLTVRGLSRLIMIYCSSQDLALLLKSSKDD